MINSACISNGYHYRLKKIFGIITNELLIQKNEWNFKSNSNRF